MSNKIDEVFQQVSTPEKKDTKLQPGQGGPGRKKGGKNRKTIIEAAIQAELVDRLGEDAAEIYETAARMAKEGDKTMIKLFMSRLLPELKAHGDDDEKGKGIGELTININPTNGTNNEAITINQTKEDTEYIENE